MFTTTAQIALEVLFKKKKELEDSHFLMTKLTMK